MSSANSLVSATRASTCSRTRCAQLHHRTRVCQSGWRMFVAQAMNQASRAARSELGRVNNQYQHGATHGMTALGDTTTTWRSFATCSRLLHHRHHHHRRRHHHQRPAHLRLFHHERHHPLRLRLLRRSHHQHLRFHRSQQLRRHKRLRIGSASSAQQAAAIPSSAR